MNRNNNPSNMGGNNCNSNNNPMQMAPMSNNMRFPGNMPISAIPGLGPNLLFNLSQYTQNTMNRAPNMLMQNSISTPLNVPTGQMNMSLAAQRLMQPGMMMQPGNRVALSACRHVNADYPGLPMSATGGGPTPHLNPNFFNAAQAGGLLNSLNVNNQSINQSSNNQNQQFDAFGRPISNSFNSSCKCCRCCRDQPDIIASANRSGNLTETLRQRIRRHSPAQQNRLVECDQPRRAGRIGR